MTQSRKPKKGLQRFQSKTLTFKPLRLVVAATSARIGNYDSMVDNSLKAFGIEKDGPEELLWELATKALQQSITEVVEKNHNLLQTDPKNAESSLAEKVEDAVTEFPVVLEGDLLDNPHNADVLKKVKEAFIAWCKIYGLNQGEAETMAARLDSAFVKALRSEYDKSPEKYSRLNTILSNPFLKASLDEQRWEMYRERLIAEADEAVFGDVFSLRQIYIPLRAYYFPESGTRSSRNSDVKEKVEAIVISLPKHLEEWAQSDQVGEAKAVCVVYGGPGSGKSSSLKMFAMQQAKKEQRVLYIPMQKLNLGANASYLKDLYHYVENKVGLSSNPLTNYDQPQNLLIILDGLDEVKLKGETTRAIVRRLLQQLENEVNYVNSEAGRVQWKLLASGRTVIAQEQSAEWERDALELRLLPYFVPENKRKNYLDGQRLLEEDQRLKWWEKYANLKGLEKQKTEEMLRRIEQHQLTEITSQPLLNYLVALAYPDLDFDKQILKNEVYEILIRRIYERGWDKAGNIHIPHKKLGLQGFFESLETIALSAWHGGDTRTATQESIETLQAGTDRGTRLTEFREEVTEGVAKLLTAFYFEKTDLKRGDFEFTHKSFGDYLVARALIGEFQNISNKLSSGDWDKQTALKYWATLCGPTMMSPAILDFLRQEVRLRKNNGDVSVDDLSHWQEYAAKLLAETIYESMPVHKLGLSSFKEMAKQARNAEESLLAMHSAIGNVTEKRGEILQREEREIGGATFKKWLMRLQGHLQGATNSVSIVCCDYLVLRESEMTRADLSETVLDKTDFSSARLDGVILYRASLHKTVFHFADLIEANLRQAEFLAADLSGAVMLFADLRGADLTGAILVDTDLRRSNLRRVDLTGAVLCKADLRMSDLREARLLQAKTLDQAYFTRRNLEDAGFDVADFEARGAIIEN